MPELHPGKLSLSDIHGSLERRGTHYGRSAATYQEPIEFSIAQIPTILTTTHNEAVIGWSQLPIQKGSPAVLIHIDRHADMDAGAPIWEGMNETLRRISKPEISFNDFIRDYIGITNFIAYAIHQGMVGVVYWWNPKEETVACYGRIMDGRHVDPPRTVHSGSIYWDTGGSDGRPSYYEYKKKEHISLHDFIRDLKGYTGPSILDWDLDSIISVEDPEWDKGRNDTSVLERTRLESIAQVVEQLPRPTGISITSSQYPKVFVPTDKVKEFETKARQSLEIIYEKRTAA